MNLFLNKICMEEAGDAAGGGTGTGTGTGGTGAGAGAGGDPLFDAGKGGGTGTGGTGDPAGGKAIVIPDNWHESISEPVRNEISNLKNFKTVEDLAKSFINAQKMVGADKIAVPGPHTTKEEWRSIQEKLGLPKVIGDYKYELPKDTTMPKEFADAANKVAYEAGILPSQMQAIMTHLDGVNKAEVKAFVDAQTASQNAGLKALETEWGDAYPTEIAKAKAAMKELVDPETAEMIRKSGLGRNAAFIKFAAKAGAFLAEDVIRGEGGSTGGGGRLSPEQAQQEINEMNKNMQHPIWNPKSSEYPAAVKRRTELFKMAHGNKAVASVSGS